jgi:hypothetical protein
MTLATYAHVIRELKGVPRVSAEEQIEQARQARGRHVDVSARTWLSSAGAESAHLQEWRGPESNWRHHDFQSWIVVQLPGTAGGDRRRSPCKSRRSRLSRPAVRFA